MQCLQAFAIKALDQFRDAIATFPPGRPGTCFKVASSGDSQQALGARHDLGRFRPASRYLPQCFSFFVGQYTHGVLTLK
jgi:hypothetical protein